MKEEFVPKRFGNASLEMIEKMEIIIDQYESNGYMLTLRQLYYQLVSRNLFPEDRRWKWTGSKWVRDADGTKNAEPNYKWLGMLLNDARLAGLIDWAAIEDRTRNLLSIPTKENPKDALLDAARYYAEDVWREQPNFVMVMVEKEALVNVVERVCNRNRVPFMACRGYMSQSEMYAQAQMLHEKVNEKEKEVTIIHLGDHDPSGIDMTRDITDRMNLFFTYWDGFGSVEVRRIALNFDQVRQYNPPPDPAKMTDARFKSYVRLYGKESWELDALEPSVIENLIEHEIHLLRDDVIWKASIEQEQERRNSLKVVSRNWGKVEQFAKTL